jgi:uncharacterized SAM-binding protein YcdF (DUF218 family)
MLLTRLIDVVVSPLGGGLLLALLLWSTRRRAPRWLWRGGLALELACLLLATPFGAQRMIVLEERRVAASACGTPQPQVIVLLAGGLRRVPRDADDVGALNDASVQRTLDASALMLADPAAQLVISGGTWPGDTVAESTLMAALMRRLGVPAASIRTETDSRTTWYNAAHVRALEPSLPARIRLVTSAVHMPRALVAFRASGFEPCAVPVDFRATRLRHLTDLLPSGHAVAATTAVLHELVGELAYRVRARFEPPPPPPPSAGPA